MTAQEKFAIDKARLHNAIRKSGLTASDISVGAGYCSSWITKQIRDGVLTKPAKVALERVGISYEDYAPLAGSSKEPVPEKSEMNADELYDIIFRAVRDALKA